MKHLFLITLLVALAGCASSAVPQKANDTQTKQAVYNGFNMVFPGLVTTQGPVNVFKGEIPHASATEATTVTIHQTNSGDAQATQTGTASATTETDAAADLTVPAAGGITK